MSIKKGMHCPTLPNASAELRANSSYRLTVVAVVVVPVPVAGIEVHVVRVVVVVRVERTGPVITVTARVVEVVVPAVASGREEDAHEFGGHLVWIGGRNIGR